MGEVVVPAVAVAAHRASPRPRFRSRRSGRRLATGAEQLHERLRASPTGQAVAALVSEHVDEVLRLINNNTRAAAVWRRRGGPLLVRHLLHGSPPDRVLLPERLDGCDVAACPAASCDARPFRRAAAEGRLAVFSGFAAVWPGGDLARSTTRRAG